MNKKIVSIFIYFLNRLLAMFVVMLFIHNNCLAQYPNINLDSPDRIFTPKDGLLSNSVYGCLQDHQGFMWFYTTRGICRYDGHRFRNFTIEDGLPTNDIWFLSCDWFNRIWVHCFDRSLYFIENDKVIKAVDLHGLFVINLLTSDSAGNVYCDEPPLKFTLLKKGNTFQYVNQSPQILDKTGWNDFQINNWHFSLPGNKDTIKFSNSKTKESSFFTLPDKGLFHWPVIYRHQIFISYSNGLYVFNDTAIEAHYTFGELKANNRSYIDRDHNIWLSTKDKGVFLYKSKNQKQSRASTKNALPLTRTIMYDKSNLFIDVKNNILELNEDKLVFEKKYNIRGARSACAFFDSSNIIFTDAGNFAASNFIKNQALVTQDLQLAFPSFKLLRTPSKVWKFGPDSFVSIVLGRYCDFYTMDIDSIRGFTFHDDKERLQTVFIDDEKNIFVFSKFKIYKYASPYKLEDVIPLLYNGRPLAVSAVKQHPKTKEIWIGTDGQGLFKIKEKKLENILENKKITNLIFRNDQFIFSNDDGIFVHNNIANNVSLKLAYTARDGVYSDELLDIRIKNDTLLAILKNEILHFDLKNNIPRRDSLLFYSFMADSIDFIKTTAVTIPYNYKQIMVQFSLFNYDYVDEVKYYYSLNDTTRWIGVEANNINLQGLAGGEYWLEVKAMDKVTGIELARNKMLFQVSVPWWRSKTFIILLNLLIWAGIFYFYRNRFRKKAARENKILALEFSMKELKLKALEAQMNPHFIYNSLSSVQYYIQANMKDEAEYFLTSFSKLVRSYLEATRKPMINLDEEVELLHRYLSLEKIRYEDKFEFELTVDPELDRKNIFINTMLLQPFVENAIQHGLFHRQQGGIINVDFKKINANLQVILTDNGIGFDKSIELKKANTKVISSRAMEIFYEKLEIINKLHPDSIEFTHHNLDDHNPEYKGTVVKIIFKNVCN